MLSLEDVMFTRHYVGLILHLQGVALVCLYVCWFVRSFVYFVILIGWSDCTWLRSHHTNIESNKNWTGRRRSTVQFSCFLNKYFLTTKRSFLIFFYYSCKDWLQVINIWKHRLRGEKIIIIHEFVEWTYYVCLYYA